MARLNKANIPVSAKQAAKSVELGTYVFDAIFQRSLVWEQRRKSNLIHSMIEGYPIPPFFAQKVDGRIYSFLDGKQRMNTIKEFINNEFYLIDIPEVTTVADDGTETPINIEGKYYKDLPEDIQDAIKDYHLTVYYYEDISPEQVRMLFAKLNNGKPLSTKERNIANCVDIVTVSDIGKHELFQNTMTEKALATRKQLPIIMKIWMMLNEDIEDVSFESKDFNEAMQETKMTDAEREEVVSVLDKIYAIYNALEEYDNAKVAKSVRKKMTAETHMVSLVPFVKRCIDEEISDRLMGDFMVELFGNGIVVSEYYADACKGGSAKNTNIKLRNDEIDRVWDAFFTEDRIENDNAVSESDEVDDEDEGDEEAEKSDIEKHDDIADGFMNEPEEVDM